MFHELHSTMLAQPSFLLIAGAVTINQINFLNVKHGSLILSQHHVCQIVDLSSCLHDVDDV